MPQEGSGVELTPPSGMKKNQPTVQDKAGRGGSPCSRPGLDIVQKNGDDSHSKDLKLTRAIHSQYTWPVVREGGARSFSVLLRKGVDFFRKEAFIKATVFFLCNPCCK